MSKFGDFLQSRRPMNAQPAGMGAYQSAVKAGQAANQQRAIGERFAEFQRKRQAERAAAGKK